MSLNKKLSLIVSAIVALVAGVWLGQSQLSQQTLAPPAIQGAIYPQAKVLQDFTLVNHHNQAVNKNSFTRHWSLVFVGYTHCPDICPATLNVMQQVVDQMNQAKLKAPRIMFLTIDPERDRVEILKDYVEYFNPNFIGLTGELDQVTQVSAQLNAVFQKVPGYKGIIDDEYYMMDHSSALMLINPQGNLQAILTAPHIPQQIIKSIQASQAYFNSLDS